MYNSFQMFYFILLFITAFWENSIAKSEKEVLKISGFEDKTRGKIGEDFTIQCINSGSTSTLKWLKNDKSIAQIMIEGCYPSETSSPKYSYTCDNPKHTFYLTIPGENMTDEEHNTNWSCQNDNSEFGQFRLYVDAPVKSISMFLYQDADDENILKFECITSASRPKAIIKWHLKYQSDTILSSETKINHCEKRYVTTSNMTIRRTPNVTGESVYCTAHSSGTGNPLESKHYTISPIGGETGRKYEVFNDNQIILNNSDSVILTCNGSRSNVTTMDIIHIGHNSQNSRIGSLKTLKCKKSLIQNISCVDTGRYMCESRITGQDSNSANLFVRCKPNVPNKSNTTVIVLPGDTLNLSVHFVAFPSATVNWTFNSAEDTELDINKMSDFGVQRYNLTRFIEVSTLVKYNISIDDYGEYRVNLENNVGYTTETFKLLNEEDYDLYSDSSSEGKIIILPIFLSIIFAIVMLAVIVKIKRRAVVKNDAMTDRESVSSREEFDDASGSVSSDEDMEMDLFNMLDVPPYENQCIARELAAESQYDDLEPENPTQTSMEWPYEEVDRSVDDPRENISLTEEINDARDLRSDGTEDSDYNNVFRSNYYENYTENLPPARLRANPPRDTVSTSSYENCHHMNP